MVIFPFRGKAFRFFLRENISEVLVVFWKVFFRKFSFVCLFFDGPLSGLGGVDAHFDGCRCSSGHCSFEFSLFPTDIWFECLEPGKSEDNSVFP